MPDSLAAQRRSGRALWERPRGLPPESDAVTTTAEQPLHAQIRDQYLKQIRDGRLRPGDRLPSEAEIMKQYGVSRGTVTRAMRDLEVGGILQRRRGSGTYVLGGKGKNATADAGLHIAMFMPWAAREQTLGSFQIELHHGISSVCSDHHVLLSLQCLSPEGANQRERVLNAAKSLVARRPKVVLYCGLELPHEEMPLNEEVLQLFTKADIQVILIDRDVVAYPDRSAHTWISYDNRRGSSMLVRHMVAAGYQRIAFLGIANDSTAVFDRYSGYCDGLRLCGLPFDERLHFESDAFPDEAVCERVLAAKPDAIICKDSEYATKLGFILNQRGLQIGRDVGLAGFDELAIASMLPVPLTVVRQPIAPFAAAVYQTALTLTSDSSQIEKPAPGTQIVIPTELVARASTRRT